MEGNHKAMKYEVQKYIACDQCNFLVGVGGIISNGYERNIKGNLNTAYQSMATYNTKKSCCQSKVVVVK